VVPVCQRRGEQASTASTRRRARSAPVIAGPAPAGHTGFVFQGGPRANRHESRRPEFHRRPTAMEESGLQAVERRYEVALLLECRSFLARLGDTSIGPGNLFRRVNEGLTSRLKNRFPLSETFLGHLSPGHRRLSRERQWEGNSTANRLSSGSRSQKKTSSRNRCLRLRDRALPIAPLGTLHTSETPAQASVAGVFHHSQLLCLRLNEKLSWSDFGSPQRPKSPR
jgi:hypothetical protein